MGSASVMMGGDGSLWGGTAARYKPFGGYAGGTPANYIQNRGFTGHDRTQADDALGVVYMNARVYMPGIGKFLTPDTLVPDPTNSQSYNRYAYVHNNPINSADPSGHLPTTAVGTIGFPSLESRLTKDLPREQCLADPSNPLCKQPSASSSPLIPINYPNANQFYDQVREGLLWMFSLGSGWWGAELEAVEIIAWLIYREFGTLPEEAFKMALEAMTRKYNTHCSEGPFSGRCVNSFWGYMQDMLGIKNPDPYYKAYAEGLQEEFLNFKKEVKDNYAWYMEQATKVISRKYVGLEGVGVPSGWGNHSTTVAANAIQWWDICYDGYPCTKFYVVDNRPPRQN